MSRLTMLSFGAGQDSTAILHMMINDPELRNHYAPNDLIVVMADTGNEHPETYEHLQRCVSLCADHSIRVFLIPPDSGYTSPSWSKGLIGFYEAKNAVGSKAFPKTCTDKLKITPIYNFLDDYIHENYRTEKAGRKAAIKEFTQKYGKIKVLLGIAKGEEKRAGSNEESPQKWMRECIDKTYPLLDLGMDRHDCQVYIKEAGHVVPPPSNCILCPFMSKQELLYLYRFMPDWYHKWVELENNKIQANLHMGDKNAGVWGRKRLDEVLIEAINEYGHMTDDELKEYKMSHGHCVKSKY